MREQDDDNEHEQRRTDLKSVLATPAGRRILAHQCADDLKPSALLADLYEASPEDTRLLIDLLIEDKLDG